MANNETNDYNLGNNDENWEDIFDNDDVLLDIDANTLLIHRYLTDDNFTKRLRWAGIYLHTKVFCLSVTLNQYHFFLHSKYVFERLDSEHEKRFHYFTEIQLYTRFHIIPTLRAILLNGRSARYYIWLAGIRIDQRGKKEIAREIDYRVFFFHND